MERSVLEALVENHRRFLRFLEARVGDRATAEDILQEAFARGFPAELAADEESAVAWFWRVLRNAAIDHHRRSGAAGRALEAFARELDEAVEPPPDVRDEVCRCIGELATTLKPEYASALQRVEVEGATLKDYAVEAGITANNAGVRLHRARAALRRQVAASCGTCADHGCVDCTCSHAPAPR